MRIFKLEEVFGVSRNIPESYISRKNVDDSFTDSLGEKKHTIIFGSSKQGKTCLRKRHLRESRYITLHCNNQLDLKSLHAQILKLAGYEITLHETKSLNGNITTDFEAGINLLVQAKAKLSLSASGEKSKTTSPLTIDLASTNDIIIALKQIEFDKIILLEDFHYLDIKTQIDFSNCLKAYYDESNLRFIIIGVWLDENKLITFNGDLAGRIVSINSDKWGFDDLKELIDNGSELLNIEFDKDLVEQIIEESFDNVYFVQELCARVCKEYKIKKTFTKLTEGGSQRFLISQVSSLTNFSREIVNQHSGRYNKFIVQLSSFSQKTPLISRCITEYLISCDTSVLQDGIAIRKLLEYIQEQLHENPRIEESFLISILEKVIPFQFENGIKPIIIDFDSGIKKLNIVDKEFIIWLSYADTTSLTKLI